MNATSSPELYPPGSVNATNLGCKCPVSRNRYGLGHAYRGIRWWVKVPECPLHGKDVRERERDEARALLEQARHNARVALAEDYHDGTDPLFALAVLYIGLKARTANAEKPSMASCHHGYDNHMDCPICH